MILSDRIVPKLPSKEKQIKIILDTDFANEIDDIYALALAIVYPERIRIEGIVGANYNNGALNSGPNSPKYSCELIHKFLKESKLDGKYTVKQGSHPMQYYGYASESEGVDFIIEKALEATQDEPLWVIGLGASTDLASAILKCPEIKDKVRYIFHSRSEETWPERSVQFNVKGDIHAARTLLKENVPLIWFDTGTNLVCPMEQTEKHLLPCGEMGKFLHEYRYTHPWFMESNKGFYDMGDIVYLIKPELCKEEIVNVPCMDEYMFFHNDEKSGKMLRVYDIENQPSWQLLFDGLSRYYKTK